jgi:pimeloyl-ACP methyl ester carboxylesterase
VQRARIDGVQFEYRISGGGDPIVFIHAAFVADSFRSLLAEPDLAERYQLITYRRRGYGGTLGHSNSRRQGRNAGC